MHCCYICNLWIIRKHSLIRRAAFLKGFREIFLEKSSKIKHTKTETVKLCNFRVAIISYTNLIVLYGYVHTCITVSSPNQITPAMKQHVAQNRDNIIKAQYKIITTLVSCKPMQPCIASITNYKSCIHCFPLFIARYRNSGS